MVGRPSASMRCSIYAAIGLVLVFVWSALSDHTFALHDALPNSLSINPRAFFLMGIFSLCVVFAAAPRFSPTKDAVFGVLLPFVGAVGTACIAIASSQNLFPTSVLCVTGLFTVGVSYCWFVVRFGLLLARDKTISGIVYALAAALIMEPIVRVTLESSFDQATLACIAVAMPLVSALFLHRTQTIARGFEGNDAREPQDAPSANVLHGSRRTLVLLLATALLLATVRTISPVGTWDAPFDPVPMTSSPGLVAIYAICVALFARFALVGKKQKTSLAQFQPAFLIVVLTLLASLILPYAQGPQSAVLYTLMCLDDSFAHILFWASIAIAVKRVPLPAYRLTGIAAGVYAVGSVLWLVLIGQSEMLQAPTMIAAIATLYILTIIASSTGGHQKIARAAHDEPVASGASTAAALDQEPAPSAGPSPLSEVASAAATSTATATPISAPSEPTLSALITANIEEHCLDLARAHGLSPRETEVMTLLAQGRTRLYIQEELVLSENTVKTHIAHVYRKLGVNNRQDLLDLVFGKSE